MSTSVKPSGTVVHPKQKPMRLYRESTFMLGKNTWKIVEVKDRVVTIYHCGDNKASIVSVKTIYTDADSADNYVELEALMQAIGVDSMYHW